MNLIQRLTLAILILNFIFVGSIGYMLFSPVRLPIIYNEPFPVSSKTIHKGETLTYTIELNKRKPYTAERYRNIICADGNLVTLSPERSNLPLGRQSVELEIIIPQKASFSTCYLELRYVYRINGLRTETQVMHTQDFTIIP